MLSIVCSLFILITGSGWDGLDAQITGIYFDGYVSSGNYHSATVNIYGYGTGQEEHLWASSTFSSSGGSYQVLMYTYGSARANADEPFKVVCGFRKGLGVTFIEVDNLYFAEDFSSSGSECYCTNDFTSPY